MQRKTLDDGRVWNGLCYVHNAPVSGCTCDSCVGWFKQAEIAPLQIPTAELHTVPDRLRHECWRLHPGTPTCALGADETKEACSCARGEGRHHPDCPAWDSHTDNYQEADNA